MGSMILVPSPEPLMATHPGRVPAKARMPTSGSRRRMGLSSRFARVPRRAYHSPGAEIESPGAFTAASPLGARGLGILGGTGPHGEPLPEEGRPDLVPFPRLEGPPLQLLQVGGLG